MAKSIFPNEVNDRILDHLHDDYATLRLCGLVCTEWIPTVRFHRFYRVRLRWNTIPRFCEILLASPLIGPYVSELSIAGEHLEEFITPHTTAICEILSRLTNLRVLRLAYLGIPTADDVQPLLNSLPRSLECIEVKDVDFPFAEDIIYLWTQLPRLRSFTSLETLRIRCREISERYYGETVQVSLQELHLCWRVMHLDVLVEWLHAQNAVAQLRACSLYFIWADEGPAVETLLRAMGPNLETLELFMSNLADPDRLYACNLGQCTGLTELRLSAASKRTLTWEEVTPGSVVWMGRFLSQVSAPNIRTIEFAFDSSPRGRKYPLLKRLQQVTAPLSSHVFRDLERVIIRLCDWTKLPVNEDVFQKIKRDLADFDVRQMLEIKLDRVNRRMIGM